MRSPLPPTPIWWTEWGVTPTHFNEVSDAVFAGTFLLRGMASCMGPGTDPRVEALSYWVVSDHFEELGRPPALLHGGFGTRTVGELRKPRWWALALLERLFPDRLGVTLTGDGAGSLVEAIGSRSSSGEVGVLAWNLTLDQLKASGSADLARPVTVAVTSLEPGASYVVHHDRVDDDHSDIASVWGRIKDASRPPRSRRDRRRRLRRPPRGHLRPAHARDVVPDVHAGLMDHWSAPSRLSG